MGTKSVRIALGLILAGGLAACAQQPLGTLIGGGDMQSAVDSFNTRYDECVTIHGYNPDDPGPLGPNELAPTERAFSDCAYNAVRTTLMLATTQPRLYDAVIAEHQTMTDKVESGMMTRDERRARMRVLREELRQKELAAADGISDGTMNLIRNATFSATVF